MPDKLGLVILAAGKGERMKSSTPKPLFDIMGRKLIDYPLYACKSFLSNTNVQGHIGIVIGHEAERVRSYVQENHHGLTSSLFFAIQKEQKGTADALKSYIESPMAQSVETIIVMYVDTPLVRFEDLCELYRIFKKHERDALLASFVTDNPTGYGRIVKKNDLGLKIVEEKEAGRDIKNIREVNSGIYVLNKAYVLEHLNIISDTNHGREYYLTDIFDFNRNVEAVLFADGDIFRGVNTLEQLHDIERTLRFEKLFALSGQGVRIIDKSSTFIEEDVFIAPETLIYPNVSILGKSHIGPYCIIEPGAVIKGSEIGKNTLIKSGTYIENSTIGRHVSLGPYAHLRPGTIVKDECRIGNFVEIKKSLLKKGVKVSHLSYVGDAEIGEETNIGCGFITCNYDGVKKHKTIIGKKTFIGSDSQMIAPITIGDHCYVASGSTIDQDMKNGDFAIARSRQVVKPNMAKRFFKKN